MFLFPSLALQKNVILLLTTCLRCTHFCNPFVYSQHFCIRLVLNIDLNERNRVSSRHCSFHSATYRTVFPILISITKFVKETLRLKLTYAILSFIVYISKAHSMFF